MSQARIQDKQERISLRASAHQKQTLREAAQLKNMTVSEFILQASLQAAQQELALQTRWLLTREQMEALAAALEAPPRIIPQLQQLFSQPSLLETREP